MNESEVKQSNITIALPCYNEAISIAKVIRDFREALPGANVVVFDNASSDRTGEIARENGARVIRENRRGKGNVVQAVFNTIDTDILVMCDGDDTYAAGDVHKLLELLKNGADMAVGNRFNRVSRKGFSFSHRFGNVLFRSLLNNLFQTKYADILSGYRAMKKEFYKNIPLLSPGFEVETELTLQALERGYHIDEVAVEYRDRPANSHSKIREIHDGSKIILTIVSLLRDYRPMVFFSFISGIFLLLGIFSGSIIIIEYVNTGYISRVPTAILTISLILVGVNAFMSGLILSAVNRRYREMEIIMKRFTSLK